MATMMTTEEAKAILKKAFIDKYNEWMRDRLELDAHDYGWKYGWQKSEKLMTLKDSIGAVTMFQKYIHATRRDIELEKEFGIDRRVIWDLTKEKWLSSVQKEWALYYFISQKTAKEIWREYHK